MIAATSLDQFLDPLSRCLDAESARHQRGASISKMLAQELLRIADRESEYELARRRALARLSAPFHLGGQKRLPREALHDGENLR